MAEIWLLLPSSLHWEICLDDLWDPFQGLLEMVPSTGTSSCLRTNETFFSDCEVLTSTFAGVSFFFHCQCTCSAFLTHFCPLVFPYVIFVPFLYGIIPC